jgi:hypothetical protein
VVADLGHHFPLFERTADLDAHLQDFGTSTIFGVYVLKLVPRILRHTKTQVANGGVEPLEDWEKFWGWERGHGEALGKQAVGCSAIAGACLAATSHRLLGDRSRVVAALRVLVGICKRFCQQQQGGTMTNKCVLRVASGLSRE